MSSLISPELMDETWRSVAVMSSKDIRRRQELCGKEQQELTAFVLAFTSDLSPEAIGLALYVRLVVIEAFRRTRTPFRKIKAGKIERTWKDNFGFINDLKQAGCKREPFQLDASAYSEPAALQYVIDALTEPDDNDPVDLDEHEFWHILQVLKTVIDCMHAAPRTR
jgi:hypothetical protein